MKLVEESYNVNVVKDDKLFYFDMVEKNYKPLSQTAYEAILNGNIRF